ncbi:MAG: amphi-Trp domain-containing protein [Anaerolineae bacterium]|nr:amphi-Trp domain-containing protein [Anaerolineae bacterium]
MAKKEERDVEKIYSTKDFVAKLRRLADALEAGEAFSIQVAGERIYIPASASISIEHERSDDSEEVEFQLKWDLRQADEEGQDDKDEDEESEDDEDQNDDEDEEQKADEKE